MEPPHPLVQQAHIDREPTIKLCVYCVCVYLHATMSSDCVGRRRPTGASTRPWRALAGPMAWRACRTCTADGAHENNQRATAPRCSFRLEPTGKKRPKTTRRWHRAGFHCRGVFSSNGHTRRAHGAERVLESESDLIVSHADDDNRNNRCSTNIPSHARFPPLDCFNVLRHCQFTHCKVCRPSSPLDKGKSASAAAARCHGCSLPLVWYVSAPC